MFLTQKPTAFDSIDLRKYHIRDIRDVIKYLEFVAARNDEAVYILKREASRLSTLAAAQNELLNKLDAERKNIGAPASVVKENKEKEAKIQSISQSEQEERNELLGEMRKAAAEEQKIEEEADEALQQAVKENTARNPYNAVRNSENTADRAGKGLTASAGLFKLSLREDTKREMWFKNSGAGFKMTAASNVPESVKEELRTALKKA